MAGVLKNDDKSIRSFILSGVLKKVSINKSFEKLCRVFGNDAIKFYDFQYWYYRFKSGKHNLDFDRSSEPEPLQFTDLPLDAIGLIVGKLDLADRVVLRHVSKPLRDFMEQQDKFCDSIHISCSTDLISISYGSGIIVYTKNQATFKKYIMFCHCFEERAVFGNKYEMEAFDDLKWILKNPKLQLKVFSLNSFFKNRDQEQNKLLVKCYKNIENLLKSLKHQIAVRHVNFEPVNPDNILTILPYLKPGYLEKIGINGRGAVGYWKSAENSQKVDEIMSLDQWEQSEKLHLQNALHLFPDAILKNFKFYFIKQNSITTSDLIYFRKMFSRSPIFEHCYFDVKKSYDLQSIGVPGPLTAGYRYVRHYMIPNSDKYLVFKQLKSEDIEIEKKTQHD